MKFITPKIHGIIDYLFVVYLLVSPTLYSMEPKPIKVTYALAAVYLLLTVLTNYPLGIIKLIPFGLHGLAELVIGVALIIIGFGYFRTNVAATQFYTWFASAVLVLWLFTTYDPPEKKLRTKAKPS